MRLEPIPPDRLTDEQRPLHDDMVAAVGANLQGFVFQREDGAVVGPFAVLLHFPQWGGPAWAQSKALVEHSTLPSTSHEVAILVVGAATRARYEIYAHERVAAKAGLSAPTIAAITAGQRPSDLTADEAAAYDLAAALVRGGSVPDSTYEGAVSAFGRDGAAELVYLVGAYLHTSALLNGFDVGVPGADD